MKFPFSRTQDTYRYVDDSPHFTPKQEEQWREVMEADSRCSVLGTPNILRTKIAAESDEPQPLSLQDFENDQLADQAGIFTSKDSTFEEMEAQLDNLEDLNRFDHCKQNKRQKAVGFVKGCLAKLNFRADRDEPNTSTPQPEAYNSKRKSILALGLFAVTLTAATLLPASNLGGAETDSPRQTKAAIDTGPSTLDQSTIENKKSEFYQNKSLAQPKIPSAGAAKPVPKLLEADPLQASLVPLVMEVTEGGNLWRATEDSLKLSGHNFDARSVQNIIDSLQKQHPKENFNVTNPGDKFISFIAINS